MLPLKKSMDLYTAYVLQRSFKTKTEQCHHASKQPSMTLAALTSLPRRIQADGKTSEIFQDEKLLTDCHLDKPLRLQGCPVYG